MLRPLIIRTFIINGVISGLGLINSVLLSRWLGPAGRGEVAAAMLWPSMLVYLSSMGLMAAILYFAALRDARPRALFANGLILSLAQSLVALLFGYLALPWLLHSQLPAVITASRWYLLVIPLILVTQYGMSILQGRMQIMAFNWLRFIIPLGYLMGTIALRIGGLLSLFSILMLHLALNLIVLMGTLVVLFRADILRGLWPDWPLAKRLLIYGAKTHVGNITAVANLNLDQMLMAALLPSAQLGLYVAAVSAAGVLQSFSQAVQIVTTPGIMQQKTPADQAVTLQGVFRRYWLLSLLITLGTAAILPGALPLIFGASFSESVLPAEVLVVGMLLLGAKEVLAGGANALGNPWLGSRAQLWALVVTLILLAVLLPTLGIMGAALASAAAYATQLIVVAKGLKRTHGILPSRLFRFDQRDVASAFHALAGSRS